MEIRQVGDRDIEAITHIYNWYILNTTITFELDAVSPAEMENRIQEKLRSHNWLVGAIGREVIGYAYYGTFRPRPAYSHTVESTIYLAHNQTGKGLGKALYQQLIQSAHDQSYREIVGLITLPNRSSTQLHHNLGFEPAGTMKNVGYKFGRYLDVGIWQKSLR